jgi:hypothetical protein
MMIRSGTFFEHEVGKPQSPCCGSAASRNPQDAAGLFVAGLECERHDQIGSYP